MKKVDQETVGPEDSAGAVGVSEIGSAAEAGAGSAAVGAGVVASVGSVPSAAAGTGASTGTSGTAAAAASVPAAQVPVTSNPVVISGERVSSFNSMPDKDQRRNVASAPAVMSSAVSRNVMFLMRTLSGKLTACVRACAKDSVVGDARCSFVVSPSTSAAAILTAPKGSDQSEILN